MTLSAGTRLGPYEILAPLGAGGMGEVYRARDARLAREVAIKVLPESLSSDPERLRRFEKEARSASALNHPNIVTIHDIGSENGTSYIAMELVDGATLREVLSDGPLAIKKLLQVAVQIAEGLAGAHEAGIVHRDLKPENVIVRKDGLVKVLDFGLAKLTEPESGVRTQSPTASGGTQSGIVVGTVGYMSPEQAQGRPLDFRSDQFSFGSMLYEMATGRRAFARPSAPETMAAIIREEPEPLGTSAVSMPLPLRWVVERCLEKHAAERYASTTDLARDLRQTRDHASELATAAVAGIGPPAARRRAWGIVAGIVAGIAIGSAAVQFARRASAENATFKRLTFRRGTLLGAGFAPDGHVLYAAAWEGGKTRLYNLAPDALLPEQLDVELSALLSVSSHGDLAILRDGAATPMGSISGGTLARVPIAGGTPRDLVPDAISSSWSPDGSTMAVLREVEGRPRLEYPLGHAIEGHAGMAKPAPTGGLLAIEDPDAGEIGVANATGTYRRLAGEWDDMAGFAWSPSGKEIWLSAVRHHGAESGLFTIDLSGRVRRRLSLPSEYSLDDVDAGGALLLERDDENDQIGVWRSGETENRDLSTIPGGWVTQLSADGRLVLFADNERDEIYTQATDGAPPVLLGKGREGGAISPDGRWVATAAPDGSALNLLPTGTGETREIRIAKHHWGGLMAYHPDGRHLICTGSDADGSGGPFLFQVDLESKAATKLTPTGFGGITFVSPDGKQIAVFSPQRQRSFLVPVSGGEPVPIPGCGVNESPVGWSEDSRHVFVFRFGEVPAHISLVDTQTGERTSFRTLQIADAAGAFSFGGVRVSPDGKSIAFSVLKRLSVLYLVSGLR